MRRDFMARVRESAAERGSRPVLRDIALHLGPGSGTTRTGLLDGWQGEAPEPSLRPPTGWGPDVLGLAYESLIPADDRRRRGAFFTPADLADELAATTLDPLDGQDLITVCDPAVGAGALLLGAVRWALRRKMAIRQLRIYGMDLDPLAADVATTALGLLAPELTLQITVGDALADPHWSGRGGGSFDAVLANPPFLNQLARRTSRTPADAAALAVRFRTASIGYADTASLFAMLALELCRQGGRVGLIVPEPMLATSGGTSCRLRVGRGTTLQRLWSAPPQTFAAGVRATALVFQRSSAQPATRAQTHWGSGNWSELAADAAGVPDCQPRGNGTVGDVALCSADFRDEFYGVAAITVDKADDVSGGNQPALITSGLIDPLQNRWGLQPARVAGVSLWHPRADLGMLPSDHRIRSWAGRRLVPKVLVATQTRVVELIADPLGALLPMVPVISVAPLVADGVWHVAAALTAPPVAALARRRTAGSALSSDSIKLSARQVSDLPLPVDLKAWDRGASAAKTASTAAAAGDDTAWLAAMQILGDAMCAAYEVDGEHVSRWWWARLSRPRSRGRAEMDFLDPQDVSDGVLQTDERKGP